MQVHFGMLPNRMEKWKNQLFRQHFYRVKHTVKSVFMLVFNEWNTILKYNSVHLDVDALDYYYFAPND